MGRGETNLETNEVFVVVSELGVLRPFDPVDVSFRRSRNV